jgi:nucleoside-diphosphate-sugar epimerase
VKRVVVTGASGFVGRGIVTALLEVGYQVVAQYRRENPPEELREAAAKGADLFRCDLLRASEEKRLADLLTDAWGVVHAAANVSLTGPKSHFESTNVDVTRELLDAAAAAGCKRFLYVGSMAVHGFHEHFDTTENGPYYRLSCHYQRTKKAAENIVIGIKYRELTATVLRAGFVYGPGASTIMSLVLELVAKEKLPLLGGFDVYNCFVHVRDFARAVCLSLEAPAAAGEVFNIAGDNQVTLKEAAVAAAEIMGKRPPRIKLPAGLALGAGIILERIHTALRLPGEPILSRYIAGQLTSNFHFNSGKAKRLLGFAPAVGWESGLRETVEAYMKTHPELFD